MLLHFTVASRGEASPALLFHRLLEMTVSVPGNASGYVSGIIGGGHMTLSAAFIQGPGMLVQVLCTEHDTRS